MVTAATRVDSTPRLKGGLPRRVGAPLGRGLADAVPVPVIEGLADNVKVDDESSAAAVVGLVVLPDGVIPVLGLAAPRQLISRLLWSSLEMFLTVSGAQRLKTLHARSQLVSELKGQMHSCCFLSMSRPSRVAKISLLQVDEIALAMSATHFWHLPKGTSAAAEAETDTERIPRMMTKREKARVLGAERMAEG